MEVDNELGAKDSKLKKNAHRVMSGEALVDANSPPECEHDKSVDEPHIYVSSSSEDETHLSISSSDEQDDRDENFWGSGVACFT